MRDSPRPWFPPKTVGYGAGLPMRWQGWVAILVFVLLLGLDLRMLADPTRWIGAALLSVGFALVARTRTRGGWRWRPGRS